MIWRNDTLSFWYAFPPTLVVAISLKFALWHFFNLSPHHVIQGHIIGRLGNVSPLPQNLIHILYPFWNFGSITKWDSYYTKWGRKRLLKSYYKVRQVLQSVAVITKWEVRKWVNKLNSMVMLSQKIILHYSLVYPRMLDSSPMFLVYCFTISIWDVLPQFNDSAKRKGVLRD